MLFCMVMETIQLAYGEKALSRRLFGTSIGAVATFAAALAANGLAAGALAAAFGAAALALVAALAVAAFSPQSQKATIHGPLGLGQRLRVITAGLAWGCGIVFVAVQGYLFLSKQIWGVTNTLRWVALLSYYAEVFGLVLGFAMPALSGVFYLVDMEPGTVLQEAESLIINHLGLPPQHQPARQT